MADFSGDEVIRGSELRADPVLADVKFLRGGFERLAQTSAQHSEMLESLAKAMCEIQRSVSKISNQLGQRQIEAESRQLAPSVLMADFDDSASSDQAVLNTEKFDSMEALLREMKQAPSIEIPEFDASNVSDWLSKVEQSFGVRRFSDLDKLDLVAFSLEGYVLQWFSWEMSHNEFRSWDEFRRRLLLKFGAASEEKASYTEQKLVSQYQVPVSSLEPSLSFSSEPLDVSASWPCAIVSNNPVHSQSVLDCVTSKTNAYQVFDKTSSYTESLKPKTKRKLRFSLKTWMFKFKHTSKKHKSLDVKFFPVEEIVAGCEKKLFDRFQTSPSYALDVVNKTSKPWETHTPFTSTPVASVNSLSFAVDNFELCVGHDKNIMRLKLLLHSGCDGEKLPELDFHFGVNHGLLVFPWNLMLLEFLLFLHLEDKVCLSAASNSCYGWMVFDRGKNHIITGDVITLVLLDNVEVGSKGLAYDGCVILGMNDAGGGRCNAELLATGQQMQRTDLLSFCCSCQNHILVAIYTEITMHTELDEKILWLLLFKKDRVMAADLGRQAGLEQISKGVKHALLHTPFQMISSVGTFVLLAQRVFQKLAAQLSKHFEILIKRIQPALYQLNCFSGSLLDSSITCSKFGHTTNMQLIVVCLLYSWGICIWFTNSWERKFCKDWRFKFKYNIRIWEAFDYGTI